MRISRRSLSLHLRVRLGLDVALERCQPPLNRLQSSGEVQEPLVIGAAKLSDGLGEPRRRLFSSLRHLLAGDLAATHDVIEKSLGALPGTRRGVRGGSEGPLDGRAEGFTNGLDRVAGAFGMRLVVGIGHSPILVLKDAATDRDGLGARMVESIGRAAPGTAIVLPAVPLYLRPSAPTAGDAVLCGDPGRALTIAQALLVKPLMSNHHRGLWGYHGQTASGRELTVQSTGIGGPSAAVVVGEMAELGLRRAIRVGTCSAAGSAPSAGSGHVVGCAIAADGTSAALGFPPGTSLEPDPELTAELLRLSGCAPVAVISRDLLETRPEDSESAGAVSDLQTAATFAACRRSGIEISGVVAVASAAGRRLEDEPLESALLRLAAAAAAALASEKL